MLKGKGIITDNQKTRLHLAYDSPFRFDKPVNSDSGIKINDYKDIVVDKLLTFFGRGEPRDAVDLFFILKKENFWKLIKLASQKDPGFDLYWMAIALQIHVLREYLPQLGEFIRKHDYRFSYEGFGKEATSWNKVVDKVVENHH